LPVDGRAGGRKAIRGSVFLLCGLEGFMADNLKSSNLQ
jgi:hypothetical protein